MTEQSQTWHYGLVARYWAEHNTDGPEIDYFHKHIQRFGEPALDAGCGTGRLLIPFLRAGLDDDYFDAGRRVTAWMGGQVIKYHRTIENYFSGLQRAGFVVDSLREAEPHSQWFESVETYRRRLRIPLFLILAATRR